MRYDKYKPENVYHSAYEAQTKKQEELLEEYELFSRKLRHGYKAVVVPAGEMIEVRVSPWFKDRRDYRRASRYRASSELQRNLNNQNAQATLVRQVNANFSAGDIFLTMGWLPREMPKTLAEAKREMGKYVKRLQRQIKKETKRKLKYIYVVETVKGNKKKCEPENKYHIHAIFGVNGYKLDMDLFLDKWKGGEYPRVGRLKLKEGVGFTGISTYFSKQMNEMEGGAEPYTRRWGHSQSLKDRSKKSSTNYSKFSRKQVVDMAKAPATLKAEFEAAFPGYEYNEEFPCKPMYNTVVGGFYLQCRMYKKRE